MPTDKAALLRRIALLAIAYVVLAKAGLLFATVGKSVTLVWPPTGLALAALLLGSRRAWPGIALGAFIANVTTAGVSPLTAAGIATGNTLEAVVGATLVGRHDFHAALDRARDVLRLALGGAVVGTVVSAGMGTLSLVAAGIVPPGELGHAFRAWWIGDAMGALLVAPALLTWAAPSREVADEDERRSPWEILALIVTLVGASLAALTPPHVTRQYLVFPPVIWAALRFGPRGATAATLFVALVTVWSTVAGRGAFVVSSLAESLVTLHAFVASVAFTALVLGATSAERARAIRAREHFISIASHELRSPLAPVRLQVQRLLRGMRRDEGAFKPRAIIDALEVVDRQVERLTRLLEDVLDLTRLRLGRLPLAPEDTNLGDLVDEVAETMREPLAHAGSSVRVERKGTLTGSWDRGRLAQVVTNLFSNAMKYGGGGQVDVTIEGRPASVTLVVRDHGPGVPEEDRDRIFGRFEHAAALGEGRGLGLGLYVAREIVVAHGGRISVSNPPGGGAAFEIELPPRPPGRRHPPSAPRRGTPVPGR